ncbi:MAG: NAD(P)/FAD-dependent oxidoreductase [Chloroflexaceae bacterium]|nr:NAD(P)/FAD-dependent oxidoreductase [Chloroflexaceae bacterium]
MTTSYDAIVIGAGHNGLVTACYLAKAGKQVLVLERYHEVGGAAITEEIHPGFRVSVASYSCSLLSTKVIEELRLSEYGFAVYPKSPSYFMPFPDGEYIFLNASSREETKQQIARFSERDAKAYDAWEDFWDRSCDIIEPTLHQPPPTMGELAQRFEEAGLADDFRRVMLLSTTDLLNEFFESEYVKAVMAPQSLIGTAGGPMTPGTPYVWLFHAIGRAIGKRGVWGYVRGGMGGITQALAKAGRDLGVTIRTSHRLPKCWWKMGRHAVWCSKMARRYAAALCSRMPTRSAPSSSCALLAPCPPTSANTLSATTAVLARCTS